VEEGGTKEKEGVRELNGLEVGGGMVDGPCDRVMWAACRNTKNQKKQKSATLVRFYGKKQKSAALVLFLVGFSLFFRKS
jgi:hypothetical protein